MGKRVSRRKSYPVKRTPCSLTVGDRSRTDRTQGSFWMRRRKNPRPSPKYRPRQPETKLTRAPTTTPREVAEYESDRLSLFSNDSDSFGSSGVPSVPLERLATNLSGGGPNRQSMTGKTNEDSCTTCGCCDSCL